MTTPVQAFLVYTKAVLTVLAFFAIFAMTVSRSYIFYEAYVAESLKRVEEAWLRQKCKDPDFYSNMRQHTNLCLQVEKNAQSSIALTALNTMVATTHLCGTRQCADYMQDMVLRGLAWPMAGIRSKKIPFTKNSVILCCIILMKRVTELFLMQVCL